MNLDACREQGSARVRTACAAFLFGTVLLCFLFDFSNAPAPPPLFPLFLTLSDCAQDPNQVGSDPASPDSPYYLYNELVYQMTLWNSTLFTSPNASKFLDPTFVPTIPVYIKLCWDGRVCNGFQ